MHFHFRVPLWCCRTETPGSSVVTYKGRGTLTGPRGAPGGRGSCYVRRGDPTGPEIKKIWGSDIHSTEVTTMGGLKANRKSCPLTFSYLYLKKQYSVDFFSSSRLLLTFIPVINVTVVAKEWLSNPLLRSSQDSTGD